MDKTETAQPDSSSQTAATTSTNGAADPAQAASGAERSTNAGEVLQRYLKAQATQISRIVASLNQYRQDVQKLEVSLIARIGDVDDDRRHAATRLQRTLQTQRDELDERLKRHGSLMAMLLLLFSLLVAGTLVFFLFRLNATQEAFETQMSDLRKTLEQIDASSRHEPDPETRVQLDRLSAALAGISKSIERLNEDAAAPSLDLDLRLEPELRPNPTVAAAADSAPDPAPEPESIPEPETTPLTDMMSEPSPQPESELESAPAPTPALKSSIDPDPSAAPLIEPAPAPEPELTPAPEPEASPATDSAAEPSEPDTQNTAARFSSSLATDAVKVGERSFTVQLIGFHTLEALERFAAEHALPVVYYYRQETYQGRPWFVLIHSLHETQEGAEAVVSKFPPALANLNIWIRKLRADTELIEVRRLGS